MNAPNANLTEDQRAMNRLRWLLTESAARASIPVTVGLINAMSQQMITVMRENQLVLTWLSVFEEDLASGGVDG